MILTIIYGLILAIIEHGSGAFGEISQGLWTIYTSPAILLHDYIAIAGIGTAFVNSGMSGLL
ncbi:MAG: DUF1576 domain-containing protein, partial [Oscillospiraceae bacterium]|nr:DUF1576 domain-containing protein [Oscillospiraceae bacterium]